jgi:hypothetical protein
VVLPHIPKEVVMTVHTEHELQVARLSPQVMGQVLEIQKAFGSLLLRNFSIEAHMPAGACTRVEYTVRMTPALLDSGETSTIRVSCFDHMGRLVSPEHLVQLRPGAAEISSLFEWAIPKDAGPWDPDWTGTATVKLSKPDGEPLADKESGDNQAIVYGTCVG